MTPRWLVALGAQLETLQAGTDHAERLASDPVWFARRYSAPEDQELAAVLASALAYGRVAGFWPRLHTIFAAADARGGPRRWVDGFEVERDAAPILPLVHRWTRGRDLVVLVLALQHVLRDGGPLGARLQVAGPADLARGLAAFIDRIRDGAVAQAHQLQLPATRFSELPRGVRYLLPSPRDGSACKRWNMALRWLVRPDDGVDLGLWDHVSPASLVIPLDTHVHRLSRFMGLTDRADGSWRTARQITDRLAQLDPADPVRFDFAIAHLGMSGGCRGGRHPEVCPGCPLDNVCRAPKIA